MESIRHTMLAHELADIRADRRIGCCDNESRLGPTRRAFDLREWSLSCESHDAGSERRLLPIPTSAGPRSRCAEVCLHVLAVARTTHPEFCLRNVCREIRRHHAHLPFHTLHAEDPRSSALCEWQ